MVRTSKLKQHNMRKKLGCQHFNNFLLLQSQTTMHSIKKSEKRDAILYLTFNESFLSTIVHYKIKKSLMIILKGIMLSKWMHTVLQNTWMCNTHNISGVIQKITHISLFTVCCGSISSFIQPVSLWTLANAEPILLHY